MRVGEGRAEGALPPQFSAGAPSVEVAAEFTGIYKILMWLVSWLEKSVVRGHYQSALKSDFGAEFAGKPYSWTQVF
jgi:hypothetical protein